MPKTATDGRYRRWALQELRIEHQLQLARLSLFSIRVLWWWWRPSRGQCSKWTLSQTAMPEDLFHDVSLPALDETDDFHP